MPYKPLSHVALIFCDCNFDRLSELSINDFIWNINSGFTPRSSNLLQYHVDGFTLFSWSFIYSYLFSMFFIFGSFNCFHSQDQEWANVFLGAQLLIASAKSRSTRGASHQSAFMGGCLTISHTCFPGLPSGRVSPCTFGVIEGSGDA